MTREEAMKEWVIPAIKNTWNENKCREVLMALEKDAVYIDGFKAGYSQARFDLEQEHCADRLTNSEWIDFLSKQFEISRTSAREMLHVMMIVKREDNFKKQFSGRKRG